MFNRGLNFGLPLSLRVVEPNNLVFRQFPRPSGGGHDGGKDYEQRSVRSEICFAQLILKGRQVFIVFA